jgi:phage terminase small subunit
MSLTPRQAKFVQAYALDPVAARAARKAGYSVKCSKQIGSRLLTYVNVQAAIAAKRAELALETNLTKKRVIGELRAAAEDARRQANPGAMIRAWTEIGKICGHYTSERGAVAVSAETAEIRARYEAMSDEELMALAQGRPVP